MLRSRNRKPSSEVLNNTQSVKNQNLRPAPLTPPTKLCKSTTNKFVETGPVKIPLVSKPNLANNSRSERCRITSISDTRTRFHKELIALDKQEKILNIKKISDTMLIAKPSHDEVSRTPLKRRKNYKQKMNDKKLVESKPSLLHQEETHMGNNRKKDTYQYNKGIHQSAQDLDGEIESYFEVLKNSISELVQEKVGQVFNSCINVMMKRFNEMADHMHHQEERMIKNINQINTKIVHYGEHHSRHFHYLCMKAEYDKLSRQTLQPPKKSEIVPNIQLQYDQKQSNDGPHCPNCPCTPHTNQTYQNYAKNEKSQHVEVTPAEGPILVNVTESNERPTKLPRGGSDSAVNIKQNLTDTMMHCLGEQQLNNNTEISVASLIGEFRKRKLAANNVGLKVPPSSPEGERPQIQNQQRKPPLHSQNPVSTQSSELGLKDIMDTIKKYYTTTEVRNNEYGSSAQNSKAAFDGCGDFNTEDDDEEYSDDYSTSHEDVMRV